MTWPSASFSLVSAPHPFSAHRELLLSLAEKQNLKNQPPSMRLLSQKSVLASFPTVIYIYVYISAHTHRNLYTYVCVCWDPWRLILEHNRRLILPIILLLYRMTPAHSTPFWEFLPGSSEPTTCVRILSQKSCSQKNTCLSTFTNCIENFCLARRSRQDV
jgi:hypothetical protein